MKIAVHSDLHTEISLCRLERLEEADLLILAGDIGDTTSLPLFFSQLRNDAPDLPVLYILGNHDRWHMPLETGVARHRQIASVYDIRLLDNEAVIFQDVLFCGTTLWTNFELAGEKEASMQWTQSVIPDCQLITFSDGSAFTADAMLNEFEQAKTFLQNRLTTTQNLRKKVVISHFLPARELVSPQHGKTHNDLIKSAYWTSDLPELYHLADFWIYGHSHDNINTSISNTRFISNQRGYSRKFNSYNKNCGYQRDYIIII